MIAPSDDERAATRWLVKLGVDAADLWQPLRIRGLNHHAADRQGPPRAADAAEPATLLLAALNRLEVDLRRVNAIHAADVAAPARSVIRVEAGAA